MKRSQTYTTGEQGPEIANIICPDTSTLFTIEFKPEQDPKEMISSLQKELSEILGMELKDNELPSVDCLSQKIKDIEFDIIDVKDLMKSYGGAIMSETGGNTQNVMTGQSMAKITDEEIEKLKKEEESLIEEEKKLKIEEAQLQVELLNLIKERPELETQENEFWTEVNKIEIENLKLEENTSFAKQNFLVYKTELDRLSRLSVLNEVFDIKVHDDMPTIAKLHLGKNPNTGVVNWDETSAGIGHICLLLNYLSLKNTISTGNVKIVPLGNLSQIVILQEKNDPIVCKMSSPADDRKLFNIGLIRIAETVKLIAIKLKNMIIDSVTQAKASVGSSGKRVESIMSKLNIKERHLELPYSIDSGLVNGKFDIKYNPKKLNDWNLALKFLLIDCKHLIHLQNLMDGCETTGNFGVE